MPVQYMPAPGYAGNAAGGQIGPVPMNTPQMAAGGAGGAASSALDGLVRAYMMAKMRKPPVPGQPQPGAAPMSVPQESTGPVPLPQ